MVDCVPLVCPCSLSIAKRSRGQNHAELARLFDESVRETDIVARYGGEEFVIVMPHTDLAGACVFAERLRAQLENRLTITISGGVAAAVEGDAQETLIARADASLYDAKSSGRNRVFCHTGKGTEVVPAELEGVALSI